MNPANRVWYGKPPHHSFVSICLHIFKNISLDIINLYLWYIKVQGQLFIEEILIELQCLPVFLSLGIHQRTEYRKIPDLIKFTFSNGQINGKQ